MTYRILPWEIVNHIIGYAITPIPRILKNDIENFIETRRELYQIYYMTRIRPSPPPTLHFLINHILAFDHRFGQGLSIQPQENNMKWGKLSVESRNYLINDLKFYYNII
jgi:hypothetical protein